MYILDTDHLSVLERKGANVQPLLQRMMAIDPAQISTTIISYEEQMRGWLSYVAKAQTERMFENTDKIDQFIPALVKIPLNPP